MINADAFKAAANDPLVVSVLDVFKGRIIAVRAEAVVEPLVEPTATDS